jgi:hypothetical protein
MTTPKRRDPEDRPIERTDRDARRDKMFDKTTADSFHASDPPSSLPDPSEDSFGTDPGSVPPQNH